MYLSHALRAIVRAVVVTGDALWKYVTLLISGTPPAKTFIYDASNNNASLTLNGDTRPSNFNPYTQGYYSAYFDGSGDYTTTADNLAFLFGTSNFTIEFWINTSATTQTYGKRVISHYTYAAADYGWFFEVLRTSSTTVKFLGTTSNSVGINLSTSNALTPNTWHHIVVSRSGSTASMFLDGVRVATQTGVTWNDVNTITNGIELGSQANAAGTLYDGYMSNVRIVKGTAVYDPTLTTCTVPTAPLTAISGTTFLACQSNRIIDNSVLNTTISRFGDIAVRGFVPFTPPTTVNVNTLYSTYFDGSGDYFTTASNGACAFGSGDFTIEFWLYANSVAANDQGLIDMRPTSTNGYYPYLYMYSGQITYWLNATAVINSASGAITAGAWYHVALTRSGSSNKLFINGVQSGSTFTSTTALLCDNARPVFGSAGTSLGGSPLNGYISNARIVKGTAVYTANFTPPTAPLTAISGTALLTCQSSTTRDNSANALAITSYGQAQPIPVSPFTQTTTAVDTTYLGSGYFDGTGDYLGLPNSPGFSMGTGDFTIEAWIYTTSSGTQRIVSSAGNNFEFLLVTSGSNVYLNWYDGVSDTSTGSNYVPQNSWTHVAISRSGTSMRLFINGIISGTSTNSVSLPSNPQLFVGIYGGGNVNYFVGSISNLRIVKGTAVYTANFAPPLQPLTAVANTSLLTLQTDQPVANKQFIDNSGNNFPITQAGNATQGSFSPYGANWSNYFGGQMISTLSPSSTNFNLTGDFTLEAWVYPISFPGGDWGIFDARASGGSATAWLFGCSGAGKIYFFIGSSIKGATTVTTNTWSHVVWTRSGSVLRGYLNGVLDYYNGSFGTGAISPGSTAPAIGTKDYGISAAWGTTGYISNLRIVNGTAVYTTTSTTVGTTVFTPPTAPLTAVTNTVLLTCQSSRFADNSNNNYAITPSSNTISAQRFSPFSPVIQAPVSYSTYFDGTGDYLTVPSNAAFQLGTGDFTFECWFNPTSLASAGINTLFNIGTYLTGLFIRCASSIEIYINNVQRLALSSTGILSTNTWQHVALVRSGSTCKVYVNGVSIATFTDASSISPATATVMLGMSAHSATETLTGYMSNVRLVKGTAVYTTDFTPPTSPLTAISGTSLLTCQSPVIVDNSSNALTITGYGNVTAKTLHPFGITSYSQYFDGTGDYLSTPSLISASGDFTLECWFNTTATLSGYRMLCGGNIDTSASNYAAIYPSGFEAQFGSGAATVMTAAYTFAPNTWYHVAMTRSGTTVKVYVNGVSLTTSQGAQSGTFAIRYVGNGYAGLTYTGYISNLRFVPGSVVYTANFAPPTAPLIAVANTALLTCQNLSAIDNSPNAFTITKSGNVSGSLANPFPANAYTYTTGQSYTPALYGGSGYFDGTGDYLTIPASTAFQFTGDYTIECWIYCTPVGSGVDIIGNYVSNTSADWIIIVAGGTVQFYPSSANSYISSPALVSNTWYHVAAVRSGTTCSLFLNGVPSATTLTFSGTLGDSSKVVRVGSRGGSSGYFPGYISDIRVVNGQALYKAGFIPPAAPLQAVKNTTLLLNMDKAGAADSSRNTDFETVGDAKIRYESPYSGSYYSNYFDGSGDYLSTPNNSAFNFPADFTVELWFYFSTTPATQNTFIGNYSGTTTGWYLQWRSDAGTIFRFGHGDTAILDSSSFTPVVGTWYHLAVSRSGTSLKMFLNGAQIGTATNSTSFTSTAALWVGGLTGIGQYVTGNISNARIVKGTAVYTSAFTPPTAPLTAISGTSLLTCQSKSFVDNSSNNFTITRNGDVAVRSYNPFQANTANSSMFFDGTGDYLSSPTNPNFALAATEDYTVECWINFSVVQTCAFFQATNNISSASGQFWFGYEGGALKSSQHGSGTYAVSYTWAPSTGVWYHVAAVRASGTVRLFVNGVVVTTNTTAQNGIAFTQSGAAVGVLTTPAYFYGYLADLRFTKSARYTANFTPPTAPLPTA